MPVVLAPPSPFDPFVSAGIGAQERADKNLQQSLEVEHQQLQARRQQQQAYEFEQRPAQQAALAQFEWTQGEQNRLNRLTQQMAWVDENHGDDPAVALDLKTQLMTKISPLQEKLKKSQEAVQQQQLERLKQHAEMEATVAATRAQFMAKASEQGVRTLPDPENPSDVLRDHVTGKPRMFKWHDRDGIVPLERDTAATAHAASHAGWTTQQIDAAAHARTVQSRPEWQSNPQAARNHPDYLDEYAKSRSGVLRKLYDAETIVDDDGVRRQKGKDGTWVPVEDSRASIAAARPEKPPLSAQQLKGALDKEEAAVEKEYQAAVKVAPGKDQPAVPFLEMPAYLRSVEGRRWEARRRLQEKLAHLGIPYDNEPAPGEGDAGDAPAAPQVQPLPRGAATEADIDAAIKRAESRLRKPTLIGAPTFMPSS